MKRTKGFFVHSAKTRFLSARYGTYNTTFIFHVSHLSLKSGEHGLFSFVDKFIWTKTQTIAHFSIFLSLMFYRVRIGNNVVKYIKWVYIPVLRWTPGMPHAHRVPYNPVERRRRSMIRREDWMEKGTHGMMIPSLKEGLLFSKGDLDDVN